MNPILGFTFFLILYINTITLTKSELIMKRPKPMNKKISGRGRDWGNGGKVG